MSQPNSWGFLIMHRAIRKDLDVLACAFARLDPSGAHPARARKRIDLFALLVSHHHHAEDEFLFPLLRSVDPTFDPDPLDAEHKAMDACLARLREAADALAGADEAHRIAARDALAQEAGRLREIVGAHLDHEEAECVRRMDTLVDAGLMKKFEKDSAKGLSIGLASRMIPWILSNATPEEREAIEAQLPWPIRALHRLFWERSYARVASGICPTAPGDRGASSCPACPSGQPATPGTGSATPSPGRTSP